MLSVLLSLLISLGLVADANEYNNLTPTEQQEIQNNLTPEQQEELHNSVIGVEDIIV